MTSKRNTAKASVRTEAVTPAFETVTLLREHEHQGERKPIGAPIFVHPETARWLRDQGVISNSPQKD